MAGDTFESWKNQCLRKCDFSKKGSVDDDISHIVSFINSHDQYFTTSSCSGRIILFDGAWDCQVQKRNCSWLFVTHQKCQSEDVLTSLEKSVGDATLKFEPFVLHVQCKKLEDAQLLHTVAVNSGFRNSGITVGKKGKIIMFAAHIVLRFLSATEELSSSLTNILISLSEFLTRRWKKILKE